MRGNISLATRTIRRISPKSPIDSKKLVSEMEQARVIQDRLLTMFG
jgi:hypothetical protein